MKHYLYATVHVLVLLLLQQVFVFVPCQFNKGGHSRYVPLQAGSLFGARITKGRHAFQDRVSKGSLDSKIVYLDLRGIGAYLVNRKKYFRLMMIRIACNVEKRHKFEKLWLWKSSVWIFLDRHLYMQAPRFRARITKGRHAFRDNYQSSMFRYLLLSQYF